MAQRYMIFEIKIFARPGILFFPPVIKPWFLFPVKKTGGRATDRVRGITGKKAFML
jgi:hypothetical protein